MINKGYKIDNDDIAGKCFDYDWGYTAMPRFIKDED